MAGGDFLQIWKKDKPFVPAANPRQNLLSDKITSKKREVLCGIYSIRCMSNGYVYIGSSKDILSRRQQHIDHLSMFSHENKYLLSDYINNGPKNFEFKVELICTKEMLRQEEAFLISKNLGNLYNVQRKFLGIE